MSSVAAELERGWDLLRRDEAERKPDINIPALQVALGGVGAPVWASLGGDGSSRFLVEIGVAPMSVPELGADALVAGIEMLHARGSLKRFLWLGCRHASLQGVFAQLCADLVRRFAEGTAVAAGVAASLVEFRELLRTPAASLDLSAVVGLVGELLVLDQLSDASPTAVPTWLGATKARHDFRNGAKAIEVKTSLVRRTSTVTISAIDQLEAPQYGTLHLVHVALERNPTGSLSVPALVESIKAKCQAQDAPRVDALVATIAGSPLPEIARECFSLRLQQCYVVDEGFPCLVAGKLKAKALDAGVSDVTYKLDLSSAGAFRLGDEAWRALLDGWT